MSDELFRILVFYLMHAIFLGTIAKGTWQSKIGNNLMLLILQYFVKQSSVRFGITLYSVLSFLTFNELESTKGSLKRLLVLGKNMKLSPYFDLCVFSLNLPGCWQGLFVYDHFVLVSAGFVSTHQSQVQ